MSDDSQLSLREADSPPPVGSNISDTHAWDQLRSQGIDPLNASDPNGSWELREEFLRGAELLRLHGPRARRGARLTPQNLLVADCLNTSPEFFALLMPRRSSKTTSLFAWALGRMVSREEYLVAYTMLTTKSKARERFLMDLVRPIEQLYPDPKTSPFKVDRGGGRESIIYKPTGSKMAFLTPRGENFRSDAWDVIIADEAGEADVDLSADILAGALATMDTRPDSTMVVAGTAAKYRTGNLLWDTLEDGRAGKNNTGIVEFAAKPDTTVESIASWDQAAALLTEVHPGVGTLTTLEKLETRHQKLTPEAFLAEYLSIFGTVGQQAAFIDPTRWSELGEEGAFPRPPKHMRLGLAVSPDGVHASISAAWRNEEGRACIGLVYNGPAGDQLYKRALELAKLRVPFAHDRGTGPTMAEAERLGRARTAPRPKLEPQTWPQVATAAALLMAQIEAGNVRHWNQDKLNAAVKIAVKRGTPDSKFWAFGRPKGDDDADITPLESAAVALRAFDEAKRPVDDSEMETVAA